VSEMPAGEISHACLRAADFRLVCPTHQIWRQSAHSGVCRSHLHRKKADRAAAVLPCCRAAGSIDWLRVTHQKMAGLGAPVTMHSRLTGDGGRRGRTILAAGRTVMTGGSLTRTDERAETRPMALDASQMYSPESDGCALGRRRPLPGTATALPESIWPPSGLVQTTSGSGSPAAEQGSRRFSPAKAETSRGLVTKEGGTAE